MSRSKRVLIIDDHDRERDEFELLMRRRGHKTLSAKDGQEGLQEKLTLRVENTCLRSEAGDGRHSLRGNGGALEWHTAGETIR